MRWSASSCSRRTSKAGLPGRARQDGDARVRAAALLLRSRRLPLRCLRSGRLQADTRARGDRCARAHGAAADGSTLLEVLAALLIMSVLGLGMWSAVSACLRLTAKIHDSTMASTRILNIDDRLRDLAGRVRAPFWVPDFLIEATETEMHVAYLDGDPSKSLILKADDGALSIDDGSTVTRYPGFQRVTMAAAQDSAGKTCGITVSLEKKGDESFSVTARFGSTPVAAGAAP